MKNNVENYQGFFFKGCLSCAQRRDLLRMPLQFLNMLRAPFFGTKIQCLLFIYRAYPPALPLSDEPALCSEMLARAKVTFVPLTNARLVPK